MDNTSEEPIASVRIIALPPGTYRIAVTDCIDETPLTAEFSGCALQVSAAPVLSEGSVEIVGGPNTFERWLRQRKDFVTAKIHGGSSALLLTSIRTASAAPMAIDIRLIDEGDALDRGDSLSAVLPIDEPGAPLVHSRVIAHIQGFGDVEFDQGLIAGPDGTGWIEGFAIHSPDESGRGVLEYSAMRADGAVTPWLDGGAYCGSRGMGLALIAFALRLKPALAGEYECVYGARFASGRKFESLHDGAMCQSSEAGDPIIAMEIKLFARHSAARSLADPEHTSPARG